MPDVGFFTSGECLFECPSMRIALSARSVHFLPWVEVSGHVGDVGKGQCASKCKYDDAMF
jgi:hypothetical protein